MSKKMTGPAAISAGPSHADTIFIEAVRSLSRGNGTKEEFEIVLVKLVDLVGIYRPPNFAEFIGKTKQADAYPMHCALHSARCEVVQTVLNALNMEASDLVLLERAALAERSAKQTR
jgi:hypothetical protein